VDGAMPEPMDTFKPWLLHRVAQAVEAGEVPVDLLVELQAAFEAAREKPQEEGHAAAVQDIAQVMEVPLEETEGGLRALEALPTVTRELLMRRVAEAWLEGQRKVCRNRPGGDM
jgi:hypothetical protein